MSETALVPAQAPDGGAPNLPPRQRSGSHDDLAPAQGLGAQLEAAGLGTAWTYGEGPNDPLTSPIDTKGATTPDFEGTRGDFDPLTGKIENVGDPNQADTPLLPAGEPKMAPRHRVKEPAAIAAPPKLLELTDRPHGSDQPYRQVPSWNEWLQERTKTEGIPQPLPENREEWDSLHREYQALQDVADAYNAPKGKPGEISREEPVPTWNEFLAKTLPDYDGTSQVPGWVADAYRELIGDTQPSAGGHQDEHEGRHRAPELNPEDYLDPSIEDRDLARQMAFTRAVNSGNSDLINAFIEDARANGREEEARSFERHRVWMAQNHDAPEEAEAEGEPVPDQAAEAGPDADDEHPTTEFPAVPGAVYVGSHVDDPRGNGRLLGNLFAETESAIEARPLIHRLGGTAAGRAVTAPFRWAANTTRDIAGERQRILQDRQDRGLTTRRGMGVGRALVSALAQAGDDLMHEPIRTLRGRPTRPSRAARRDMTYV